MLLPIQAIEGEESPEGDIITDEGDMQEILLINLVLY